MVRIKGSNFINISDLLYGVNKIFYSPVPWIFLFSAFFLLLYSFVKSFRIKSFIETPMQPKEIIKSVFTFIIIFVILLNFDYFLYSLSNNQDDTWSISHFFNIFIIWFISLLFFANKKMFRLIDVLNKVMGVFLGFVFCLPFFIALIRINNSSLKWRPQLIVGITIYLLLWIINLINFDYKIIRSISKHLLVGFFLILFLRLFNLSFINNAKDLSLYEIFHSFTETITYWLLSFLIFFIRDKKCTHYCETKEDFDLDSLSFVFLKKSNYVLETSRTKNIDTENNGYMQVLTI
ncbi:hypothetical protein SSYRP_v1c09820 [Spiroplasma syrphidicola EA-1]|uniref:Transmembrane protein n=1 Tax=Spiroplasma syrphidicola EA-1 TaxID=1276229 RepID=R4UF83_9MOLU|nr:hypothetical protein [Spiroplasma syrphidicola]AGM26569.1 hypothetical protein SSYRP_v1c09820 [Spiroplasma syrphidicola EA-1]